MKPHQAHSKRVWRTFVLTFVVVVTSGHRAIAQASAAPQAKDSTRTKVFEQMRQTAGSFKTVSVDGDTRTAIPLVREPIHRWTDPTRETNDGSLWAWRSSGRPIAVMTIEWHSIKPETWSLEFISLSTGLVEANDGRLRWAPRTPGISFREIPDAPPPAAGEAERLRQMRELR